MTRIYILCPSRSSVRVTLWDEFARNFAESLKEAQDFPVILILGCARVTTWSGMSTGNRFNRNVFSNIDYKIFFLMWSTRASHFD